LSDFTHKVFQVSDIAMCTYGFAFIGERNVAAHVAEFARAHQDESDLEPRQCGEDLAAFIGPRLDAELAALPQPLGDDQIALGFLVGGYGSNGAELWDVTLPQRSVTPIPTPGAAWRGQTDVIQRILKGWDATSLLPLVKTRS
jgi:hypothetical protein